MEPVAQETITKLNAELTQLKKWLRFYLTDTERDMADEWIMSHDCPVKGNDGAIGGRITYEFTPTGLGIISRIKCSCKKSLDLTDFESW